MPRRSIPLEDARNLYVARTYAYVAGGKQGLVIVDVEKPEHPRHRSGLQCRRRDQRHPRCEARHDHRERVRLLWPTAKNGMRIVQLFAPNDTPNYLGHTDRSRKARNARRQLEALGYDVIITLREDAA